MICITEKGADMSTATMNFRLDQEAKDAAADVAQAYGFDLSSVLRAVCVQMARTRTLPVLTNYRETPNSETLDAMAWGDAFLSEGRKARFSNIDEVLEAMEYDEAC